MCFLDQGCRLWWLSVRNSKCSVGFVQARIERTVAQVGSDEEEHIREETFQEGRLQLEKGCAHNVDLRFRFRCKACFIGLHRSVPVSQDLLKN